MGGIAPLQDWQRRRRKPSLPDHPPEQPLTGRQWFRLTREHLTLTELSGVVGQHHSCTRSFLNHLEGSRVSIPNLKEEKKNALNWRVMGLNDAFRMAAIFSFKAKLSAFLALYQENQ
ncbi:hypothetical protein [Deinococcus sp.]|uniref:hypothetical protein n=1 Tax=Deinococcus sp. TaxID=47478 RepID=UPI003918E032